MQMVRCGGHTVGHALIVRRGLPTLGSRQSHGPVAIWVFCVHPLVSAFEFLLCDTADQCWQT